MNNTLSCFYLIVFVFLNSSCKKSDNVADMNKISKIKAESAKLNKYFDDRFKEYVDRSPMFQTRLGIKTNQNDKCRRTVKTK